MSTALDAAYYAQRARLAATVYANAARFWAGGFEDRELTVARTTQLVAAGQTQTVALVDAYMTAKMRDAIGRGEIKGLSPGSYGVESIRGKPAEEIYDRPFGALGAALERGEDAARAATAAKASLDRLVRTDIQLTQTHAARDWMAEDDRVTYYNRVLGGGKNCELCIAASDRRYYREDLAAIHERCGCSVAPSFGEAGPLTRVADLRVQRATQTVQVVSDEELGARLLAAGWAG